MPPIVLYLIIGAGAAVENVFPPIPSDAFVLIGAFLAAENNTSPYMVFLVTWIPNVVTSLGMYAVARRYGKNFLRTRVGKFLLSKDQLARMQTFYDRWGASAMFFSRFIPTLRALVPVFGGLSDVAFWRVALPVSVASAIWYGALVFVGTEAGRNFDAVMDTVEKYNRALLIVAILVIGAFVVWWFRTRRERK
jgi:membrane protein DedA with SNARE-associated domain